FLSLSNINMASLEFSTSVRHLSSDSLSSSSARLCDLLKEKGRYGQALTIIQKTLPLIEK
ncbi:MAG: hypothetical protein KJ573_10190, partial [Proteobacteria bacterium]|nr:hypothetical protein [Pseudomonadota bacterium]